MSLSDAIIPLNKMMSNVTDANTVTHAILGLLSDYSICKFFENAIIYQLFGIRSTKMDSIFSNKGQYAYIS